MNFGQFILALSKEQPMAFWFLVIGVFSCLLGLSDGLRKGFNRKDD